MSIYDERLKTLRPNNREVRPLLEALQALLQAGQTIEDLLAHEILFTGVDGYGYTDDLRVPFTQTKLGANLKPDFDETNVGYLFPQNDAGEKLYFVAQIPHSWIVGTDLLIHLHWQQSAATAVTWKADLKVVVRNTAVPAEFTTYTGSEGVFPYTSGDLSQITRLGTLDLSAVTATSALILGKVYRDDNTTTGDVLAWELDFHFRSDAPGSRGEFEK